MKQTRLLLAIVLPLTFLSLFWATLRTEASPSAIFTVNSTIDAVDVNPGDGVCETAVGNGVCTLRAAIQESNKLVEETTINLPAGYYTLTLTNTDEDSNANGDLDIDSNITITGMDKENTIIQAGLILLAYQEYFIF